MLMIRLQRVGRKHEPVFRLVVTDRQNSTKSGKFLEVIGNYDSRRGEKAEFDTAKIKHWLSKGAKLSDTVHNLLIERKVIEGKKINVLPKKKPIVKEAPKTEGVASSAPTGEKTPEAPVTTAPEAKPVATEEAPKA